MENSIMKSKLKIILLATASTMLIYSCTTITPAKIYSERECEMPRSELTEIITNILKMNNFTIILADSNMISASSNSEVNFDFNAFFNNRAKVEKYHIKWDFIISKLPNSSDRFKVISSCYKIDNEFRANISTKNPNINYSENTFPVGRHYRRGRTDAVLYYAVVDALRHICGTETEYYIDKYDRMLHYDVAKGEFYVLGNY